MNWTEGADGYTWRERQYARAYEELMTEFVAVLVDCDGHDARRAVVAHYKARLEALRAEWGQTG